MIGLRGCGSVCNLVITCVGTSRVKRMRNRYCLAHFCKKIENSSANILASEYPIKKILNSLKFTFHLKISPVVLVL